MRTHSLSSGATHDPPHALHKHFLPQFNHSQKEHAVIDNEPTTRTLHLVDLENQVNFAGRKTTLDDVKAWWSAYKRHIGFQEGDRVLVGVSPRTKWMFNAFRGERGVEGRTGHSGPDGADDALLASVYVPDDSATYARCNIVSGDGAFTGLAKQLRQRGVIVRVVTTGDTWLAPKLKNAAHLRTRILAAPRSAQSAAAGEHSDPMQPRTVARAKQKRHLTAIQAVHAAGHAA